MRCRWRRWAAAENLTLGKWEERRMPVGYILVNLTKKEQIVFAHLPVNKAREICGNPVSAAIVSWYLLRNSGDQILFLDDCSPKDIAFQALREVTDQVITELIDQEILEDHGIAWQDEREPATVFIRDIRNRWLTA